MKRLFILAILNWSQLNSQMRKRLKIFAAIGLFGFAFFSVIFVWAGFSVVRYAFDKVNQVHSVSSLEKKFDDLKREFSLLQVQTPECQLRLQSLLSVASWLQTPIAENLKNLKTACVESKPHFVQENSSEY